MKNSNNFKFSAIRRVTIIVLILLFSNLIRINAQTYTCGTNFQSPNYPGVYPNSTSATYTFTAAASTCVQIHFTAFTTESGYDYLYITNNGSTSSYSGSSIPADITSTASNGGLTGTFTSNSSTSYTGWTATVTCVCCTQNPLPAPQNITATPSTLCSGSTTLLNATSTGNVILWYTTATGGTSIGQSLSGANFSVSPLTITTYYAESYSTYGCYSTRTPVTVTVNSAPTSVTAYTKTPTICSGATATFDIVSFSGGICSGGNWEYEWRDGSGNIVRPWSTTSAYTTPALTTTVTYYLYVRCSSCPTLVSPASNGVVVTVNSAPTAVVATTTTSSICTGGTATFQYSSHTGGSCNTAWQYEWLDAFGTVVSAWSTTSTYTTTLTQTTTLYLIMRCGACAPSVQSNPVTVTVSTAPTIVNATTNTVTICSGTSANFQYSGHTGGTCLGTWEYQWTDSPVAGAGNIVRPWNATSTYTTALTSTVTYYLYMRCSGCPTVVSPASNAVTVNVISAPTYVTGTTNTSVICAGGTANFQYSAHSGGSCIGSWEYQWQDGTGTVVSPWSTTSTYSTTLTATTTYYLYMRCSGYPTAVSPASNAVTVIVNAPPTIVVAYSNTQTICVGSTANFLYSSHTGGSCTGSWEYQWTDSPTAGSGNVIQAWSTTSALSTSPTTTTTYYLYMRCSLCPTLISPASNGVTVTVNSSALSVTATTSTPSICAGNTATYQYLTHSGGSCSGSWEYEWRDALGNIVRPWSQISSYSTTLTTTTTYYLYMRCNSCPTLVSSASNAVTVSVDFPPTTVTGTTTTPVICAGATASFDYLSHVGGSCTGSGSWEYEWRDGYGTVVRPWSTTALYSPVLNSTQTYYLYMRCSNCPLLESPASTGILVTVNSAPTSVTAITNTTTICAGATANFQYVGHTGGNCSGNWEYEWRDGTGNIVSPWSTTSTYSPALTATATYYLYMRCSLCPSLVSPVSNGVMVTVTPTVGTPVFVTGSSLLCQDATNVTYTAAASNSTGVTYSISPLTAGTIVPTTGVVDWDANFSGNATITATAAGCNGPTTANMVVTIIPTVGAPVFTVGPTTLCQASANTTYTATSTNSTGLTYSMSPTTAGTISVSTGIVVWNPSFSGLAIITATSTGCNGPAITNLNVTIVSTVGSPVFTGGSSEVCMDAPNEIYTATATTNTGITYSISPSTAGTIDSNTGEVDWNATYLGNVTITATATGCNGPTSTAFTVIVDSIPAVNSALTKQICSGVNVAYTPTSNVASTTFTWTASLTSGTVTGFSASGTGNISDVLYNSTTTAGTVTYTITSTGPAPTYCVGTPVNLVVTVDPIPDVTSILSEEICSGASVAYTPTSGVVSTTYTWIASLTSGTVSGFTASGTGAINDILYNTTFIPGSVTYTITPIGATPNYCVGIPVNLVVTVNPIPQVTSQLTEQICSGVSVNYTPTSGVANVTYSWTSVLTSGTVSGNSLTGAGTINDILDNYTTTSGIVTYTIIPTGPAPTYCSGDPRNLDVTVDPIPSVTSVLAEQICSNTSVAYTPASGVSNTTFSWISSLTSGSISGNSLNGSGNILDTLLNNSITSSGIVTYSITPTGPSPTYCVGNPSDLVVTVDPTPTLTSPLTETICSGVNVGYTPTSGVASTTFAWTSSVTSGTINGNTLNGTGNITDILDNLLTTIGTVTYTITSTGPTPNYCVGAPTDVVVTVNPFPTSLISGTASVCNTGTQNLPIQIDLTGTAPWTITYSIDGVDQTPITNVMSTPYIFYVNPTANSQYVVTALNDANCTGNTFNGVVDITVYDLPTAQISGTTTICNNGSQNIPIQIDLTGSGPWDVVYSLNGVNQTITGITTSPFIFNIAPTSNETYSLVSVTDIYCTGTVSGAAIITVNQIPTATITGNSTTICDGQTNNTPISVTLTGTAPWTLTMDYNGVSQTPITGITSSPYVFYDTPAVTTTYTINSVIDSTNCTNIGAGSATVTVNPIPVITNISASNPTTCAINDGNITITATGANEYSIDGGINYYQNNGIFNNLSSGTYNIIVRDNLYNCLVTGTTQILSVPVAPVVTLNSSVEPTNTICAGQSVTFTASGVTNGTYEFFVQGVSQGIINAPQNTFTTSSLTNGQIVTVTGSQSGCAVISNSIITTVNSVPTATISGSTSLCNTGTQSTTISVALTGNAPWTLIYAINGVDQTPITGILTSPYTFVVNPTTTTTYTVTDVSDVNNCNSVGLGIATVTVNDLPTAVISGTTSLCNTGSQSATISISLTGTAPWTIIYSENGVDQAPVTNIMASPYTFNVNPTNTTTYTLSSISDVNCAGTSYTGIATVTVNDLPTAVISGTTSLCNTGSQSATISVSLTGIAPWTIIYSENGVDQAPITNIMTSPYTFNVNPTITTTYALSSVSDVNCVGTSYTGIATVTVNDLPTAVISGTTDICNTGTQVVPITITLTGTAPWSVTIDDGSSPTVITGILNSPYIYNVNPTTTTTYTLTALNDTNCIGTSYTGIAIVTVKQLPVIDSVIYSNPTDCSINDGTIFIYSTGADEYSIDGGITYLQNSGIFTGLGSGVYNVVVRNSIDNCPVIVGTYSLYAPGAPVITLTSNITSICSGQSITFSASGISSGGSYEFYIDGISEGIIHNYPDTTFTTSALTNGQIINVVGTNGPCSATSNDISVTVYSLPTATISGTTSICNTGTQSTPVTITLTGTAPWTIIYSENGVDQTPITNILSSPYTINVSPVSTTTYAISALSDANCIGTNYSGIVTVTVNDLPSAIISGTTSICNTGTQSTPISVTLTGNAPWTIVYAIDGVDQPAITGITSSPYVFNVSPITNSDYTISAVSDVNCAGTSISGIAQITVLDLPTAAISGDTSVCNTGSQSVSLNIALTGTAPWNITYTDGTNQNTVTNIMTSSYIIYVNPITTTTYSLTSVNDANCVGSLLTGNATINMLNLPTATISGDTTLCNTGTQSTPITVNLTGTGPWSITYAENGVDQPAITGIMTSPYIFNVSPLSTTMYTISAVSDSNCIGTLIIGSATVTINDLPTADINGSASICNNGTQTGAITVNLTGTAPWSITYAENGIDQPAITGIMTSPYIFNVMPTITSTYTLSAVSDANCIGTSFTGTAQITVLDLPTAILSGDTTLCNTGTQSTPITVNLTGTAPWSITYAENGVDQPTVTGIMTSPYVFNVSPTISTVYTLSAVNDVNCVGSVYTGSATVVVNDLPTGAISGTTSLCNTGVQTTPITVTLTGTAPWSIIYAENGVDQPAITGILTSPYIFNVSPLITTTYTLTSVSDINCNGTTSDSAVITVNDLPTGIISGTTSLCNTGTQTTPVSVNLTGTAPWSITIDDGTNSNIITGILATPYIYNVTPSITTTYTLTAVSDANCVGTYNGNAIITINNLPTATGFASADTVCYGTSVNVSVNLTGVGPWYIEESETLNGVLQNTFTQTVTSSPYTFPAIPNVGINEYSITLITDSNGCTNIGNIGGGLPVTVIGNPIPTGTITANIDTVCSGYGVELTVALTGTGPWSVDISETINNGTPTTTTYNIITSPYLISVLPSVSTNVYTITSITDANGCTNIGNIGGGLPVTVIVNPLPVAPTSAVTDTNNFCENSVGSINLSVPDGSGDLLNWSTSCFGNSIGNGNPLNLLAPVVTTTYYARWENSCGNSSCASITVVVNQTPIATVLASADSVCYGAQVNLTVNLTGTGPWYVEGTESLNGTLQNTFTQTVTSTPLTYPVTPGIGSNEYLITLVTDSNACSNIGNIGGSAPIIVITNPLVDTPIFVSGADTLCQNSANETYIATATNSTNIIYSIQPTNAGIIDSITGTVIWDHLFFGTATVTATASGGCGGNTTSNFVVTINPTIGTPVFISGTTILCQDSPDETYNATCSNSTIIEYYLQPSTAGIIDINTGVVNWDAGFYGNAVVTAVAYGICGTSNVSVNITVNPTIGAPVFTSGATTLCQDSPDEIYIATALNSSVVYSISPSNAGVIDPNTGLVNWSYNFAGTAVITATVTIGTGCGGNANYTDLNVTITPTVGIPNFINGATTLCQDSPNEIYNAQASDATGIIYSINPANAGVIDANTGEVDWNSNYSGTAVIIATANGCNGPATNNLYVTIMPKPINNIGSNSVLYICYGGVLHLTDSNVIVNGYSYSWTGPNGFSSNEQNPVITNVMNDQTGIYNLTVSDGVCINTGSTFVTVRSQIVLDSAVTNAKCGGPGSAAINVISGGTSPFVYYWTNGETASSITNLASGSIWVTVTDFYNCQSTREVVIGNNNGAATAVVTTDPSCNGSATGSATVYITNGISPFTYNWSYDINHYSSSPNASGFSNNSATANGLMAGFYVVTVTDFYGCTAVEHIEIKDANPIIVDIVNESFIKCNGGNDAVVRAIVTGGTYPLDYQWSNSQTGEYGRDLRAGKYFLTVSDVNKCSVVDTFDIIEPPAISSIIETGIENATNNGYVQLTVTGGIEPYNYKWTNDAITENITGLSTGKYIVTVTDANGCYLLDTAEIGLNLIIPTAITPNNDGINDRFEILNIASYSKVTIEIYNRWGDIIFKFDGSGKAYNDPKNCWDGKYNGQEVPIASYVYIVKLDDLYPVTGILLIKR